MPDCHTRKKVAIIGAGAAGMVCIDVQDDGKVKESTEIEYKVLRLDASGSPKPL